MSKQEILEGNKIIAKFMQYNDIDCHECKHSDVCNHLQCGLSTQEKIEQFKFHSSYDWIMPVVEKIEQLLFPNDVFYNIHILGGCCVCIISSDMDELGQYSEPTKILTVFKAVVEFIKWYNEQNK